MSGTAVGIVPRTFALALLGSRVIEPSDPAIRAATAVLTALAAGGGRRREHVT